MLFKPLSTGIRSRKGASGCSVGDSSNEVPSAAGGPVLAITHAVGHVDHAEAIAPARRPCALARERRHHGVEQRQRQRGADAAQHRAARDGLRDDDHDLPSRMRKRNGTLATMPIMIADHRYAGWPRRARCARTAGMSAGLHAAAERVGQQLLGERADELVAVAGQDVAQAAGAVEPRAVRQDAEASIGARAGGRAPSAPRRRTARAQNPSGSIRT